MKIHDDNELRRWLKLLPSRENIDDLHRIALTLEDPVDEARIHYIADLLQGLRQAVRGGRLNPRGSRHWNDEDIEKMIGG